MSITRHQLPQKTLVAVAFHAVLFGFALRVFGADATVSSTSDALKTALTANVWTWVPTNTQGGAEQLTFDKDGMVRDQGNWDGEWQVTGPLEVALHSSFLNAQAHPNSPYKDAVLHFNPGLTAYTGADFFGDDKVSGERKAPLRSTANVAEKENSTLKDGLILYYNFNSEPVGGKIIDVSGQGNDGMAIGVDWVARGHQGGSASFAISKSYITVSKKEELDPPRFTLAAWIKTTTRDAVWRRIFDKETGVGFDLTMGGDNKGNLFNRGRLALEVGPAYDISPVIVADGNWHQVVGTFDGDFLRIYIDGQLQRRAAQKGKPDSSKYDLTIGANRSNPDPALGEVDASFNGQMDDVMMYNRALSESEIKTLYLMQNTATDVALGPSSTITPSAPVTTVKPSVVDRLKQLDDLLKQGLITQADYDQKKKEILDSL